MIERVNVVDVGSVKTITDKLQQGGKYRDRVDDVNFRDHEPIGAGYIAAWLKHQGFKTKIIWPRSDVISLEETLVGNPQAICFSSLTFNYPKTKELAEKVRLSRPDITIIIGGYHATCVPKEVSAETFNDKPLFDFVVEGEGELNIDQILRYQNSQFDQEKIIGGLVYRDGKLWVNNPHRFDLCLNPIPLRPKEKMAQSRRYGLYYPAPSEQRGVALFAWSRGCPYDCVFCCSKTMFPTCTGQPAVMYRDIKDIIREIRFCQKKYGTNLGFAIDLNTPGTIRGNGDVDHGISWLRELCQEIKKTGMRWYSMCRLDIDPTCFKIMRDGGCTQIGFGVESLTNRLKSGTRLDISQWRDLAKDVADQLRDLKVMSKFYYILGGLTDDGKPFTADDILKEGQEILDVHCDTIRLSWMVYPLNRPAFTRLQSSGLLEGNGRDLSLMSTEFPLIKVEGKSSDELQIMRTEIMSTFFSPKRYGPHARAQIKRVPKWEKSFLEFDDILHRQFGQGWRE